ncbi:hypothetical protein TWF696_000668 [Orbilia brochopaga]|uniref:Uncharacterized protein n=1 Tax=Orbilia brochopaga TaxID=3140254 RepID=A0AAV9VFI7_9PEZI
MKLYPEERAEGGKELHTLYNDLREMLPVDIRDSALKSLGGGGVLFKDPRYLKILQAVLELVQVVLRWMLVVLRRHLRAHAISERLERERVR